MNERQLPTESRDPVVLSPARFDAVLFDLDGVLTDTARVHAAAWTRMFDDFLERRARDEGVAVEPFTPADYRRYVDGRPRRDGVRAFLASRGISLPEGSPADGPDQDTVHGLGVRKNDLFVEQIRRDGVDVDPSAEALIRRLRGLGIRTAVVTASRNRVEILRLAGLEALFDTAVDGEDRGTLGLRGKPAPDTFLEAARRLGVSPERSVVVEDAVAGVEAGRNGGFGLVVGVDRTGDAESLRAHGADVVVPDLSWLEAKPDPWQLVYDGFDPALEGRRETLLALGNGYLVTRGAAAEAQAGEVHYPGTYLAGGYNRLTSMIDGRPVEHEDLVNLPNWLPVTFRIDDGEWFDPSTAEILEYRRTLDLRRGLYQRTTRVRDGSGRVTRIVERRFVHMREEHLAGQHVAIRAEDWAGRLTVRALLDGRVTNAGVLRYRPFDGAHVRVRDAAAPDAETVLLEAETTQSQLRVTQAARLRARVDGRAAMADRRTLLEPSRAGQDLAFDVAAGDCVELEKIVALYTSRDRAIADGRTEALTALARAGTFDELLASHTLAWAHLWQHCDVAAVEVDADAAHETHLIVRLHVFHLLQTVSAETLELDVGVPARGWHGEGYRGHIFWDELFIFPYLVLRMPVLARTLLLYRYRRLPEARWAARAAGYRGAMFPWQSGSNGREETDVLFLNPRSGRWITDDTHLQRHVGAAIAYNVWQYHQATDDSDFLYAYGAELLLEIARFWASIAEWNEARRRYEIRGVLGPDEFHDRYPGASAPGLNNNTYTNVMASWCLARALEVLELLPAERGRELCEVLGLEQDEIARWDDVSRKLYVPMRDDGVPSQFEGFDALEELDWEAYRTRYGNIGRLDLILEAEGDSPNRYKLSKQADVLMLFYLFSAEGLSELFARLGYPFESAVIPRTIDYYLQRTSEGSTLSGVVHAWVLARSARSRSWPLFVQALRSDIDDIQGGTTAEGIHLGAMAGTVDLLQRCYPGLELRAGELRFHPRLPDEIERLSFQLHYRGHSLAVELTPRALTVTSAPSGESTVTVVVDDRRVVLEPGARRSIPIGTARRATGGAAGAASG
ncbi:MAG: beta-phosphoglucomutase family hydrolase [Brachybacterium paraconglomeratum]|nr:beta-phosphoglucomutase family hydrolase [Brachybacterium paraconglomeratum]